MRAAWFALLAAGCGTPAIHHYEPGLLGLAAAASAKEVCSCVFVVGQTDDWCREWTRVSPDIARFTVDRDAGRVTAHALLFGRASAHFVDQQTGCVLD